MNLFHLDRGQLNPLDEENFSLEKDIQKLTEENLQKIFDLHYVSSEFTVQDLRIDTLAFDPELKSFVIIEYKRDKSFSVIDQGYAYLSLMLSNRAEFILEYQKHGKLLKKDDIDWSQSRVIFVSPSFTQYQQRAIQFKNIPIELWEIKKYQRNLIAYTRINRPENTPSMTALAPRNEEIKKVTREVKVYTEQDHISSASEPVQELYEKLKRSILELGDDIKIAPRKLYIAFKRKVNFVDIEFQKSRLKIYINLRKGTLDDPKKLARDIKEVGHWGNGDYLILLSDNQNIPYVLTLIKQAYDKN